MKINSTKRFQAEDYPKDVQSWIGKLFQPLNQFLEQAVAILQNGITVTDNMKSKKWDLTLQANQSYPIKLAYPLNEKPSLVMIGSVREDSGTPSVPASAYCVHGEMNGTTLEVTVLGLDASKRWKITVIAIV